MIGLLATTEQQFAIIFKRFDANSKRFSTIPKRFGDDFRKRIATIKTRGEIFSPVGSLISNMPRQGLELWT